MKTLVSIDLLDRGRFTDSRVAEEVIFAALPWRWSEALIGTRSFHLSFDRVNKLPVGRLPSQRFSESFYVRFPVVQCRGTAPFKQSWLEHLSHVRDKVTDPEGIHRALTEWPTSGLAQRGVKSQIRFRGEPHTLWTQDLFLIGRDERESSPLLAAWQLRLSVFFPTAARLVAARDRVPLVRIEMLQAVGDWEHALPAESVMDAIENIALQLCNRIGLAVAGRGDVYVDNPIEMPMELQISVLPGMEEFAKHLEAAFFHWRLRRKSSEIDEYFCLTRLTVGIGHDESQPEPRKTHSNKAVSIADDDGTLLVLVLPIKSLSVTHVTSGEHICTNNDIDFSKEFVREMGATPKQILHNAGITFKKVQSLDDYDAVVSFLQSRAEKLFDDEDCDEHSWLLLRDALTCESIGTITDKVVYLCALINLKSRVQYAECFVGEPDVTSFLDNAFGGEKESIFSGTPRYIRASKKLLSDHPAFARWAEDHGVSVVHPRQGFQAGALQAKQWNMLLEDLVRGDIGASWISRLGERLTLDELRQRVRHALRIINGATNGTRDNLSLWWGIPPMMYSERVKQTPR